MIIRHQIRSRSIKEAPVVCEQPSTPYPTLPVCASTSYLPQGGDHCHQPNMPCQCGGTQGPGHGATLLVHLPTTVRGLCCSLRDIFLLWHAMAHVMSIVCVCLSLFVCVCVRVTRVTLQSVALPPAKQCCMLCVSQLTLQRAAAEHLLPHVPTERRLARIMHCFCGLP